MNLSAEDWHRSETERSPKNEKKVKLFDYLCLKISSQFNYLLWEGVLPCFEVLSFFCCLLSWWFFYCYHFITSWTLTMLIYNYITFSLFIESFLKFILFAGKKVSINLWWQLRFLWYYILKYKIWFIALG